MEEGKIWLEKQLYVKVDRLNWGEIWREDRRYGLFSQFAFRNKEVKGSGAVQNESC